MNKANVTPPGTDDIPDDAEIADPTPPEVDDAERHGPGDDAAELETDLLGDDVSLKPLIDPSEPPKDRGIAYLYKAVEVMAETNSVPPMARHCLAMAKGCFIEALTNP